MFFVVDQNILRKPELKGYLESGPRSRCVLIDTAFLEMTQSETWEDTLRSSLNQLAHLPERVFAAYSVSHALAHEMRTLQSVDGHMLWRDATLSVREVLTWVRTGRESATILRMRESPAHTDPKLRDDHFHNSKNKQTIESQVELVRGQLSEEFQKALRKSVTSNEDRLDVVHQLAKSIAYGVLEEQGVSWNRAHTFLRKRPLFYRYLIVHVWNSLYWLQKGGLEGFKDATNELHDHHYAITASFFNGLLSRDAKVKRSHDVLKDLVRREV
jgi:hypothetical protein